MSLTEAEIRAAKPRKRAYVLSDGRGLVLDVKPAGQKYWFARIWQDGKERRKALGLWPDVSLREARKANYAIRDQKLDADKFEVVAEAWFEKLKHDCSESYAKTVRSRLDKFILPRFGNRRLDEVKPSQIIALCHDCEAAGMTDTAQRLRQFIKQIYDFAAAADSQLMNPAAAIGRQLVSHTQRNYSAVETDEEIGELMRRIRDHSRTLTRCAMMFSAWTALRPQNVYAAEWSEINLNNAQMTIKASKMKLPMAQKRQNTVAHVVPLPRQAVEMLRELKRVTGHSRWVFPSAANNDNHMSNCAGRSALRAMGYLADQMTWHGFRAVFSTVANRNEWNRDVIEEQLAHKDKDKTRRAYNRAQYLPQRAVLAQWMADYYEAVRDGRPIPPKGNPD